MNIQEEKTILKEEKIILAEVKKEQKLAARLLRDVRVLAALVVIAVVGLGAAAFFFAHAQNRVYIEKSQISAPTISLAPVSGGKLEAVYVNEGDSIEADTVVAQVGNELVKSKISGLVIMARGDIGKLVAPGEAVVSMIDPAGLRVVGQLEEDKGLAEVGVGDRAVFTVDAFGGRQFEGVVDEVSPTSRAGDVVFNISDKRQEQEFDVKVRFDWTRYPELKNGMSAKLWIYRQ